MEKSTLATASSEKQGGKKEGKKERTGGLQAGKHKAWPRPLTDLVMKNLGRAGYIHFSSPQAVADAAH